MSTPAPRGTPGPVPAQAPAEDLTTAISELHEPPPQRTPAEDPLTSWDPEIASDSGPARQPHLASAFAALLAAEEGHPVAEPDFGLVPAPRLTDRELEVLKLVATGMNNRDIAKELFISENTVKNHVRNILEKLQLHSRMEAVVYAMREKILEIR